MLRDKGEAVLDFSRGTSLSKMTWRWAWDHLARHLWVLRHPLATRALRRHVRVTGQTSPHECERFIQGWLKTVVRLQRAICSYDIILMDQGFLQTLWAIGYQADPTSWPQLRRHLLRLMPVPNAVILVEASHQTAARRLRARPGITSRVERDGPESAAVMKHAIQLTDELRHDLTLPRDGWDQTTFYPFNNDADTSPTAALATIVQDILAQPSRAPASAQAPAAIKVFASSQRPPQSSGL